MFKLKGFDFPKHLQVLNSLSWTGEYLALGYYYFFLSFALFYFYAAYCLLVYSRVKGQYNFRAETDPESVSRIHFRE